MHREYHEFYAVHVYLRSIRFVLPRANSNHSAFMLWFAFVCLFKFQLRILKLMSIVDGVKISEIINLENIKKNNSSFIYFTYPLDV